ncbi:MAG: PDZ domain-containing protein, partial [Syntrophaceae bacterium]|nr:PDZ domain-containing protein [Syntrophaceae bacterium]
EAGVIIIDVENGSPAEDAGLRPQDIVVQVNRVKVSSIKQYTKEISMAAENRNVTLLIQRGKSRVIVSLHIE